MSVIRIKSIIKEYFSDDLIRTLERIYKARNKIKVDKTILDNAPGYVRNKIKVESETDTDYVVRINSNNDKINISKSYLMNEFGVNCGYATGTNRFALLIDGYALKIAQDPEGVQDNFHEFYMSKIAYPYVTKVYETNGLISVHEYIRVLAFENDFDANKSKIMKTLENLLDITSLMLDVGCIQKNRSNWGIRPSTGEAVSLDFAYMYTELEDINLTCDNKRCNSDFGIVPLSYTSDYSTLICPKCHKLYSEQELHALVDEDSRRKMYNHMKNSRRYPVFKVTKPVSYYEVNPYGEIDEVEDIGKEAREKDTEKKLMKKEDAQRLLDRLVELHDDFNFRKVTGKSIEWYEQNEYDEIIKTLCEFRFNKKWCELTDEQKMFDPLCNYKGDTSKPKYKHTEDVAYVNDVVNSVNFEFHTASNETRQTLIKGILEDIYDVDDIFTPVSVIKKINSIKNNKTDKPYVDEYETSILDDIEGNILKMDSIDDQIIEHDPSEYRDNLMQQFIENDREANNDYYDDEECDVSDYSNQTPSYSNNALSLINLDPDIAKFNIKISGINTRSDGSKEVLYSFMDSWTLDRLQYELESNSPEYQHELGYDVLDVRAIGAEIFIEYDHPDTTYHGDGVYTDNKTGKEIENIFAVINLPKSFDGDDDEMPSEDHLKSYSLYLADQYRQR